MHNQNKLPRPARTPRSISAPIFQNPIMLSKSSMWVGLCVDVWKNIQKIIEWGAVSQSTCPFQFFSSTAHRKANVSLVRMAWIKRTQKIAMKMGSLDPAFRFGISLCRRYGGVVVAHRFLMSDFLTRHETQNLTDDDWLLRSRNKTRFLRKEIMTVTASSRVSSRRLFFGCHLGPNWFLRFLHEVEFGFVFHFELWTCFEQAASNRRPPNRICTLSLCNFYWYVIGTSEKVICVGSRGLCT